MKKQGLFWWFQVALAAWTCVILLLIVIFMASVPLVGFDFANWVFTNPLAWWLVAATTFAIIPFVYKRLHPI